MNTVLPSSSARWRTGICGESGFDFSVVARCHASVARSRSAAASAPTKFGMRPSGFGNRRTPGAPIAVPHLLPHGGLGGEDIGIAPGVLVVSAGHRVVMCARRPGRPPATAVVAELCRSASSRPRLRDEPCGCAPRSGGRSRRSSARPNFVARLQPAAAERRSRGWPAGRRVRQLRRRRPGWASGTSVPSRRVATPLTQTWVDAGAADDEAVGAAGLVVRPARSACSRRCRGRRRRGRRRKPSCTQAALGDAERLVRVAGEAPDGVLERQRLALADPVAEQVGRVAGVAELAGVGAGVGQAEQGALVGEQVADLVVVVVLEDDAEAGGHVVVEREVEQEVERRGAPLGGELVERDVDDVAVAAPSPRRSSWTSGGSSASRVTSRARSRHAGVAVERRPLLAGTASTSFHTSISANGTGSVMAICITIGRQAICGYTSPGSAAPRSTVRSAAPGLSVRVTSAVQVTGDVVRDGQLGELVEEQPGPDRHLDDALAQLAEHRRPARRPRRPRRSGWAPAGRRHPGAPAGVTSRSRWRRRCIASRTMSHIVVDLVGGRRALVAAEHEQPQRRVADEGADVEPLRSCVDGRQVLGERLEAPVDARLQRLRRHALDVLERAHDRCRGARAASAPRRSRSCPSRRW